ncbi:MAG: YceI family protein [Pyrinomonadaceae bacterium]|nr:YceI family protein [Pyrinomonadaceae bacterium]
MTTGTPAKADVVHYRLLADQSTFTVQAFSEGLLSAFGHDPLIAIRDFTGESQFVPGTFEAASLKVTVNVNSLAVSGDVKEKDRLEMERTMREEVLEVEKYPEIVFLSTNISASRLAEGRYRARIIGDLTLHGVAQKNLWISAETTVIGDSLRAQGEFSLKQTDFGIKPYSVAGGTIKLKNELKFAFDIAAQGEG